MRFFSSELGHEYSKTYTFGYCNYAALEKGDGAKEIEEIYARGYLPYSGSPDVKDTFYMARSGRIALKDWELNSECRRIAKKFDDDYIRETVPFKGFPVDERFKKFWLDYFARAHGPLTMSRARLQFVLDFGIISQVGVYRDKAGTLGGYTLEVATKTMSHDWYQAWVPGLDKTSFGMWLLLDIGRAAQARGASYYYPGTLYGNSFGGNYKTNLPGLQFWNGEVWMHDEKHTKLKRRLKTDVERRVALVDEWKEGQRFF